MLVSREPRATLVVCDDDAPTLELLCDHLEADRFRVLPAPSASDALRLCHYKQPDPWACFFLATAAPRATADRRRIGRPLVE
jgi:CheY-like chemotaxis protein